MMYPSKFSTPGLLLFIFIFTYSGCADEKKPVIKIEGSTTILSFMVKVSERCSEKESAKIQIHASGSTKGIEALLEGKCSIAMSSSPISDEMLSQATSKGIKIKGFSFAKDLVVPIVHPSNPVKTLNIDQLHRIYTGNIKTWNEVGGQREFIDVVTRTGSSGTGEVWKQLVLKSKPIKTDCTLQSSNSSVLAYIAEHPNAMGYVSFAILNHEIKPVSINGVTPTLENEKQRKYPISRSLYLYVDEKNLSYEVKSLIVFILSEKGQEIVRKCGFIPRNALK